MDKTAGSQKSPEEVDPSVEVVEARRMTREEGRRRQRMIASSHLPPRRVRRAAAKTQRSGRRGRRARLILERATVVTGVGYRVRKAETAEQT